jgi:pyruvate formate lyase activating enzyme
MFYIAKHLPEKCLNCGWCSELVNCPGSDELICIGCGACVLTCPNEALELVEEPREKEVRLEVDGKSVRVPERISVKQALAELGYQISRMPDEPGLFAPCEVGGCGSCAMEIDDGVRLACRTIVKEGMRIRTELPKEYVPRRIVTGFFGHPIGGVGTPWQVRVEGKGTSFIEVVCFAAGCDFRCPQCQNFPITYLGKGEALTPKEAAERLTEERRKERVKRLTISGGECTLNKPWLIDFIRQLKALNPDKEARLHIDTNGSLLSHEYIDELVEAGMTDIGIDLKALETDTFMRITGLKDKELAERYKETAWEAVSYIVHSYPEKVFVGIGIPYNRELTSMEEISRMGERLCQIDPNIQVCALNYMPAFRSHISIPENTEMERVRDVLKGAGLKTVLAQTTKGFVGP